MCTMAASAVIRLGHCVHNGGECSAIERYSYQVYIPGTIISPVKDMRWLL